MKAGGSTNFVSVFKDLELFIKNHEGITDMSIIFFTDGCDTCNTMPKIIEALEKLQKRIKNQQITSRFLTIGFTNEHDAAFLNRIAQSGTDLGNFFFVNTENADYGDQIKECLSSSLSMAQEEDGLSLTLVGSGFKETVVLPKVLVDTDGDEDKPKAAAGEITVASLNYDFTTQMLIKESAIDDLQGVLNLSQAGKTPVIIEKILVENPTPQTLAMAQVKLINRLIFDTIQEIQQAKRARTNQQVYEYVKTLD